MINKNLFKKSLTFTIVVLLFGTGFLPIINGDAERIEYDSEFKVNDFTPEESFLDAQYIYNITKALSDIIFTEYNESAGEIAKGRYFGTKGEHKAAEILLENLTNMGLFAWKEQIKDLPSNRPYSKLTHKQEILDFGLKINDMEIKDCYISPKWIGLDGNIIQSNNNFSFKDLKVKLKPDFLRPILDDGDEDYVFIEEE